MFYKVFSRITFSKYWRIPLRRGKEEVWVEYSANRKKSSYCFWTILHAIPYTTTRGPFDLLHYFSLRPRLDCLTYTCLIYLSKIPFSDQGSSHIWLSHYLPHCSTALGVKGMSKYQLTIPIYCKWPSCCFPKMGDRSALLWKHRDCFLSFGFVSVLFDKSFSYIDMIRIDVDLVYDKLLFELQDIIGLYMVMLIIRYSFI